MKLDLLQQHLVSTLDATKTRRVMKEHWNFAFTAMEKAPTTKTTQYNLALSRVLTTTHTLAYR